MRKLVFAVLFGLVLVPLSAHAQSITLDVCNTGTVDIDVFVSQAGSVSNSHIRPSACAPVAKSAGGMEPAYLGIAFTDSRGQWGATRRFPGGATNFGGVPSMGVKELPAATWLAMKARGESIPRLPNVLSMANRSETVRHGNASVSLPMQLLFQPDDPECRKFSTGGGATLGRTTIIEVETVCEDLVYTLKVQPYADSREATLGSLDVGGFFSTGPGPLGITTIRERSEMNWAEEAAELKLREAPQPINWADLLPAFKRVRFTRERLSSGEPFRLPPYIVVRGTVAGVEIRQQSIDANTNVPVAEINFRESPLADGQPYPEFNVCTDRLDILQDMFGADYRASMIGKVIEVQGRPQGLCWGQIGEIQILLARQVRQVPSVQFAAGTRVWVPPPVYVPPARTPAQIEADKADYASTTGALAYSQTELRAKSRMSDACVAQHEKALAANPRNQDALAKEYFACQGAVNTNARAEAERGRACAQQIVGADPESMKRGLDGTWQKIYDCAAASTPTPAPAAAVVQPAPQVTRGPAAVTPAVPAATPTVAPTARAGALSIANFTAQWVGKAVIATGRVARVETKNGFAHLYFQGPGNQLAVCYAQGLAGPKDPSELIGKTVEVSGKIDSPVACFGSTVGALELRQASQIKLLDSAAGTPEASATLPKPSAAPVSAAAPAAAPDDSAAGRAKALQEQQQRAQKAQACMQQLLNTYPDSGRSDPAGFQKGLLACSQALQAQPAK